MMNMNEMQRSVEAVVRLMEDWADWQRGYRLKLGYPTKSAGIESGGGSTSFDDICDESDAEVMRKVDACVNDLSLIQRSAVLKRYGIAVVFRFPRENYETVLCEAHVALTAAFSKKGIATA